MKKDTSFENILVEKLVFGGKGFARLKHENKDFDGRVLFITGGAIPGQIVNLRVLKSKKDFIETQIIKVVKKSPLEKSEKINPFVEVAGASWIEIPYENQLEIKEGQILESFRKIKKYDENILEKIGKIIPSPIVNGYRNKVEYSFGKYISEKENRKEEFNFGFHAKGRFSQIEDIDGFILVDDEINKIFLEVKKLAKNSNVEVYDPKTKKGFFRHLVVRKAYFTKEIMLILGFNHKYFSDKKDLEKVLEYLKEEFKNLEKDFPNIKSIYFSFNDSPSDVAIGELELIFGEKFITEKLLGLEFEISPSSFFQTNSSGAEVLYGKVLEFAENISEKKVLDLYAGTGTIGMFFAKNGNNVVSVELSESASKDGEKNAKKNNLEKNIKFVNAKVEDFLGEYLKEDSKANLLIIDPPRSGMHPKALEDILKFDSKKMIYVSCNPATLIRDLEFILKNSDYKIGKIAIVDMFPHTHHIETIVKFEK